MSNRIQIALVKQLNRQLRIAENKENQRLHRELRHRIRKFKLVNDHFDERRDEISISFENYREQIVDAVAINKMRFELCIDEKIETIVDYEIDHEEIVDDTDEFSERMYSVKNSLLFFSSLYPTNNIDTDNIKFYWFVLFVILYAARLFCH
jgi:hypothetical protein